MTPSPSRPSRIPLFEPGARMEMFRWLEKQTAIQGDVLSRASLLKGFVFGTNRIPTLHPAGRGIWKPKQLDVALSLTTTLNSPYSDRIEEERLLYSYQGTDPGASDNRAVRRALQESVPLAYFHAVERGWYFAAWPMFVVSDNPANLRFAVQAEPAGLSLEGASISGSMEGAMITGSSPRRAYGTAQVRIRIHQRSFRERVLAAYKSRCAMCNLTHRELLDAAHIVPDSEGGEPCVTNGLSLCKIHHAAFDARILGVHPTEHRIAVREDVLDEVDGPMLRHGIQGLNGQKIWLPRSAKNRPAPEALTRQWDRFVDAS